MLKKFITVTNVGKFRNCRAKQDIEFRKLSLIFGDNSRGKTTLTAVLRSLQSGDPNPILERRTADSSDTPSIQVLTDAGTATFKDGAWDVPYPNLAIFDSHYVANNVYSGDYVEHDHRKNLARIVLGEEGVVLANRVDELNTDIREANNEVNTAKASRDKHVPKGILPDVFFALPEETDIDTRITAKRQEVAAITNADSIIAKAVLAALTLPAPPPNLDAILATDFAGVSTEAETKLREHIQTHHMQSGGEHWLSDGLQYIHYDSCPFCGQDITVNELLTVYRSYFTDAYRTFNDAIVAMDRSFQDSLSDSKILPLQTTLAQNEALADFWKAYVPVQLPLLSFDSDIAPVLSALREALSPYVARKLQAPLDIIAIDSSTAAAALRERWTALNDRFATYNAAAAAANRVIAAKKTESASGDLATAESALLVLRAQKTRYTPDVAADCDAYQQSVAKKKSLEEDKRKARSDLDTYAEQVIGKYEASINALLKRFAAGFRITGSRLQYGGGTTSSSFQISINDVAIDLGDERTPPGTPCFRSTVGAGDRSTLALAFFLVQLHERKDLADLTIVFDDPFTSLDSFRQHATRDQIHRLVGSSKQVIVLSHYPQFLRLLAEDFDSAQLRLLCVARQGKVDSVICPWDLHAALARGYDQDIATLAAFYHGEAKDLRSVMRCIRPVLEAHIRRQHPTHFPEEKTQWLGDMLSEIRDASDDRPIADLKPDYDDLASLNAYTKRYHHDDNTARTDAGPIQETELQAFAEMTLEFTGRL